ncbi:MAG: ABC transporter permease [Candidatus Promineifilaceae bacterium]
MAIIPTIQQSDASDAASSNVTVPVPISHWEELWEHRYLLQNMIMRDLKVRYKNSFLGILWTMLNPLLLMLVFTLVFNQLGGDSTRHYPIFVLVGLMPWTFFNGSVVAGANSILANSGLVKKVYFPREILPTASILSGFVNYVFTLIVLVLFLYGFGIGLTRHALWVPLIVIAQLLLMLGLVYFLSAAYVFYRDVGMILEVIMTALFFLTPIFYSLEMFGVTEVFGVTFDAARVMRWVNPLASIIDAYRTVLWGSMNSGPASMGFDFLLRTYATVLLILGGGYAFFRRTEPLFGEKL